jgi:predicted RNA-binding protein with PUA-like domain
MLSGSRWKCRARLPAAARSGTTPSVAKQQTQYWLMKTEPDVYSIDDLARDGRGTWEGVRNYQARNYLRAMRVGDLALFYHSNAKPPGVVGLMRIVRTAYPDDTQFDPASLYVDPKSPREAPRWDRVDVAFEEKLRNLVSLDDLKAHPRLGDMLVVQRGQRLSVQPVIRAHFELVLKLGR